MRETCCHTYNVIGHLNHSPVNSQQHERVCLHLLWGGVSEEGELVLEPSFAVDAPASLPRLNGLYHIVGEDAGGGALFSLRFGTAEIADADGEGGSFAFVIPVRSD